MTIISNLPWTINIHGNAPTTGGSSDGKMTKWNGTDYFAATKLHNALNIVATDGHLEAPIDPDMTAPANYSINLTGTDLLLGNGIPEGQDVDGISGETRTVTFNQNVIGSDAALSSGFSYHIVASFTAANVDW